MQLTWIPAPLATPRTITISKARLLALGLIAILLLLLAGNLLHFIGLRLALEYRPEVVRAVGGVMTLADLERVEAGYRQRLDRLREELATTGRQVSELQSLKEAFKQLALPPQPGAATPKPGRPAGQGAGATEAPGRAPGLGGPFRSAALAPERIAERPLPGVSLFEDIDLTRGELRSLAKWMREARSEWQGELDWLEHHPTGVPLAGQVALASRFGMRLDPFTQSPARHEGIDLIAPVGTPILAAASGRVIIAHRHPQYGLMVELDHGNGYRTRYAHARSLLVSAGEVVRRGQPIATLGSTGRSTGPHLHYEVLLRGLPHDPQRYVAALLQPAASR